MEERIVCALDLNNGGIKIEVADFLGRLHAGDYLDWGSKLGELLSENQWEKVGRCCL